MGVTATHVAALRAASLFDIDPELAEGLDARRRAEARARAIVATVDLPAGPWSPTQLSEGVTRPFALMVVDGLVLRELLLAGSTATELLGPCDIVALAPSDDALLPSHAEWMVPQAARIAVLDDRIMQILRTWPGVGRLLLDRAARREARLSTHRAIAQLPRVDQRLLAFFAHLSERWGRVGAEGVVMPLHLTHEPLGRLIGARPPRGAGSPHRRPPPDGQPRAQGPRGRPAARAPERRLVAAALRGVRPSRRHRAGPDRLAAGRRQARRGAGGRSRLPAAPRLRRRRHRGAACPRGAPPRRAREPPHAERHGG